MLESVKFSVMFNMEFKAVIYWGISWKKAISGMFSWNLNWKKKIITTNLGIWEEDKKPLYGFINRILGQPNLEEEPHHFICAWTSMASPISTFQSSLEILLPFSTLVTTWLLSSMARRSCSWDWFCSQSSPKLTSGRWQICCIDLKLS